MIRNRIIRLVLILSLLFAESSCRKEMDVSTPTNNLQSFDAIFKSYWTQMSTNYVYWDIDTTNWDNVYKKYQPLFANLKTNNNDDLNTAFSYFESITQGITDGHYTINFNLMGLSGRYIYPAATRKVAAKQFHTPYNYIAIDTGYLDKGFKTGYFITSDNKRLQVTSGLINNQILYFNCNLFSLKEAFTSQEKNSAAETLSYFFNLLKSKKSLLTAVVVDVRNNPGGNIEDLNFFVGHFIDKRLNFGYTRYKNGSGRKNYTPWISAAINPDQDGRSISIPIIVLTDHFTVSLAEAAAMALRCLPNVSTIGEQTWGATGPITNYGVYNDGSFEIHGVLSVYTSSAAFKYIDGKMYEGIGFPPDLQVTTDPGNFVNGHDDILDKALQTVR